MLLSFIKNLASKLITIYPANQERKYRVLRILGMRFVIRVHGSKKASTPSPYKYLNQLSIQDNKIVMLSIEKDCGNSRAIAAEILRRKLPYDVVWVANPNIISHLSIVPPGIRIVMSETTEAWEEMASAKVWIDNIWRRGLLDREVPKKSQQLYVQIWHGSPCIKKCGHERNTISEEKLSGMHRDMKQVDWFVSSCRWDSELYKRIFNAQNIVELGHPKNDIFFRGNFHEIRSRVLQYYKIEGDKKILFYAPTLGNQRSKNSFSLNIPRTLEALKNKFGGEWVAFTRMHTKGRRKGYLAENERVIDVSDHPDIGELLIAADVCISDYSSCIFDYLFTGKPGFLYVPIQRIYEKTRGLYYPVNETPFPYAENMDALEQCINQFDPISYKSAVADFLKDKLDCREEGQAAVRFVDWLQTLL